jgi:sugar O-acyltransferase (sialic acid O-acetyltransferase NeuD family)
MPASSPQSAAPTEFDPTALVLYGGGGHGKTLIDLVRAAGNFHWVGLIDDRLTRGSKVLGVTVLGGPEQLVELYQNGVCLAVNGVGGIGDPAARQRIFDILEQAGFTCPAVVHPAAFVEQSARLEGGVQVLAKAYVSSSAYVGFGSVLNAGATVSHDCRLGRCVNLSPGAALAGNVRLEDYVQVGMNATINLDITVGRGARIGNGATVKADVPPDTIVRAGTIWPPK